VVDKWCPQVYSERAGVEIIDQIGASPLVKGLFLQLYQEYISLMKY
jgi:hypothetical protein